MNYKEIYNYINQKGWSNLNSNEFKTLKLKYKDFRDYPKYSNEIEVLSTIEEDVYDEFEEENELFNKIVEQYIDKNVEISMFIENELFNNKYPDTLPYLKDMLNVINFYVVFNCDYEDLDSPFSTPQEVYDVVEKIMNYNKEDFNNKISKQHNWNVSYKNWYISVIEIFENTDKFLRLVLNLNRNNKLPLSQYQLMYNLYITNKEFKKRV